jgi:uncharacterized protein YjbI with pentapeptide repeats
MTPRHPRDEPGQLPGELTALNLSGETLADGHEFETCALSGEAAGASVTAIKLDTVRLEVKLPGGRLSRLSARTTNWARCDLSNVSATNSDWFDTKLAGSRLTGINLAESTMRDVCVENCKLDLANFRFTKLRFVTFRDCILTDADFGGATLRDVSFANCDLTSAHFSNATLSKVDLRGSKLDGITSVKDLAGAVITSDQLLDLSHALAAEAGIVVKDDPS